jgi:ComF family protein
MLSVFNEMMLKYLAVNPDLRGSIDLIIPIPLHRNKLRLRGYNQSELLAKTLSGITSKPVSTSNLIKTKNTPTQTSLLKNDRLKNLKDSFSVFYPSLIKSNSILLVDDVMTTGTTLNSCAAELLKSGAKEVFAFTLARTL